MKKIIWVIVIIVVLVGCGTQTSTTQTQTSNTSTQAISKKPIPKSPVFLTSRRCRWITFGCIGTGGGGTVTPPTCDANATPSTFSAAVSSATSGQTICLATGDYGTWTGVSKTLTITAAQNAVPTMKINFGSGASNLILDHISGMSGTIVNSTNVTIRYSTFTDILDISGSSTSNISITHDSFIWNAVYNGSGNAKIALGEGVALSGTLTNPSVTVSYNDIENGNLDGVHIGDGSGILILNNIFKHLCDTGTNHTDNIQWEGGSLTRVAGNYVYEGSGCDVQGITSFDGGTNGIIIENNVVDILRDWAIEFYSDTNSIIRHNTLIEHPNCSPGQPCGQVSISNKTGDPCGSGTHVYDNIIGDYGEAACSHGVEDHNYCYPGNGCVGTGDVSGTSDPSYKQGSLIHDYYLLNVGSPASGVADDGSNAGIFSAGW